MTLVALRQAVIDSIDSEVSAFVSVEAHGGRFNKQELKRIAMQSPAARVAVFGGKLEREGVQAVGAVVLTVFIITRGTSSILRDEAVLTLVEAVAGLVAENKWGYADAKAPDNMRIDNLYSGDIDRNGVALWSVSWTQRADLAIFDDSDLGDFNKMYNDWDLAPIDGVADMQDQIWLNGEFMSAYEHIYVSTAVATSIAVADTYQKAAGTTTAKEENNCDMPTNGRARHTGSASKPFLATASVSVSVSGDAKVTLALAKGGTVDEDTEIEEEVTVAGGAEAVSLRGIFDLDENEYVEVWVKADDTVNVTLTKLNLIIAAT